MAAVEISKMTQATNTQTLKEILRETLGPISRLAVARTGEAAALSRRCQTKIKSRTSSRSTPTSEDFDRF